MKLIIDIPDDAYSMITNTVFTEDVEVMFKQSAEDRRKTLQLFATLDAIKDSKPYEERPQGEWVIVKDEKYGDNVKCPFCGKELAGTDLNFCCKCGAKLIGSEKLNGGAE